jgi:hypothetical protein
VKIKAILTSAAVGLSVAVLSFEGLETPATLTAVALRHKMPDAWFSGLVVWYASFTDLGISIAIGAIASRMIYKRASARNFRA